jgi:flagellar basal-body rod modification protein FlgD
MDVTPSSTASTVNPQLAQTKSAESKSALSSDFQTFLRMLTTQMENQDPLNPMESTEFATQLATFSSVEQQTKSNDLLSSMVMQLSVMSMTQITGWVGMEARTSGAVWVDNRAVELTPEPASAADRMAIVVRNESGLQVGRLETTASDDPLSWMPVAANGEPLPAGAYTFELESLSGGEVLRTDPLETYSKIVEVRNEDGGTQLVLEGGVRLPPTDISALREPVG